MPRYAKSSGKRVSLAVWKKMSPAQKAKKRASLGIGRIRGHGAYTYSRPGPWGRFGRAVGNTIGGAGGYAAGKVAGALTGPVGGILGGPLGGLAGRSIGGKIGSYLHYIGRIFGSGDYVTSAGVNSNSLSNGTQAPSFGSETVRIRHREYLGDVVSSPSANTFQIQSFNINPGQSATLPWLAPMVGATFQQYRINGMVFEFRSMSADALNSTNTALGQVIMCTDYDSKDSPFTTKQQMENTSFGVSCKPSCSMIHAIECARNQTAVSELYVRAFSVPTGADIRLYDLGIFYIATNGCQGTSVNLGELWVSYDITFFKPIEQPPGYLIPYADYPLVLATAGTTPLIINTAPTAPQRLLFDNIGLTFDSTGLILTFPTSIQNLSVWEITLYQTCAAGGAAANNQYTFVPTHGFANNSTIGGQARMMAPFPTPGAATNRVSICSGWVVYTNPGDGTSPTITFTAPVTPLTQYATSNLFVRQLPGNCT